MQRVTPSAGGGAAGALVGARWRDRRSGFAVACGVSLVASTILVILVVFVASLIPDAHPLPDVGLRFERSGLVLLKRMAEPRYRFRQMDLEWLAPMQREPIHSPLNIGHHGLADKRVYVLQDGRLVMVKPAQRASPWPHSIYRTERWLHGGNADAVRLDRQYQGWGEIAAFHVDRALGLYRVPPITSRFLSSKLFYKHDESWMGRVLLGLPEHQVPVSVHAWLEDVKPAPPLLRLGTYLRAMEPIPASELENAREYSTVLVFDYLVDEYDRLGSHNWKRSNDGLLLAWDNGLAWNHGPIHRDLDILCGPHLWNTHDDPENLIISKPCKRICVFEQSVIDALRARGPTAPPPSRLGNQVKQRISLEAVAPVFEWAIFRVFHRLYLPAVLRYHEDDFFHGLDLRVTELLQHVDECIRVHGNSTTLI